MPYPYSPYSFIDLINTKYPSQEQKDEISKSSERHVKENLQNRMFDELEVIPSDLLEQMSTEFVSAIQHIIIFKKHDDLILDTDEEIKLEKWIKGLAQVACDQLIDSAGCIKLDVIHVLDLRLYRKWLNPCDLVCAFIGAINQEIIKNPELMAILPENLMVYSAVSDYVNKNYRRWAIDVLHKRGVTYQDDKGSLFRDILAIPKENPGVTMGVVGGFIAAATALGVALFATYNTSSKDQIPDVQNTPGNKLG